MRTGLDSSRLELVQRLHDFHSSFTVEIFVRGTDNVRSRVPGPDGDLRTTALEDANVYHAATVFQLKAMLFQAGILTERGAEPDNLDPANDVWTLRHPGYG